MDKFSYAALIANAFKSDDYAVHEMARELDRAIKAHESGLKSLSSMIDDQRDDIANGNTVDSARNMAMRSAEIGEAGARINLIAFALVNRHGIDAFESEPA